MNLVMRVGLHHELSMDSLHRVDYTHTQRDRYRYHLVLRYIIRVSNQVNPRCEGVLALGKGDPHNSGHSHEDASRNLEV